MSTGSHRLAEAARTALLLLCFSTLAVVVAELAMRLVAPQYPPAHVLDERLIYRMAGNTVSLSESASGTRRIRTNSHGYRGPDPDLSPERTRIAVYGDSFIHARFSDLPDTFSAQLERALAAKGLDVQALNAGVDGYGPDQSALRIQSEFDALRPALVILAVHTGNDFGDLVRNAIYRVEGGELVQNDYAIHPKTRAYFADKEALVSRDSILSRSMLFLAARRAWWENRHRPANPVGSEGGGARGSDAFRATRLRWTLAMREREYRKVVVRGDHRARLGVDSHDLDVSLRPTSESARYKRALMEAVLVHVRDFLAARSVPLVILVIPTRLDTCGEPLEIEPGEFPDYRRSGLSDAISAIAESHGIPHLDLFPEFTGPSCREFYLATDDAHWNALGQARAAERMAELLAAELP